jgi:hypothetical protein
MNPPREFSDGAMPWTSYLEQTALKLAVVLSYPRENGGFWLVRLRRQSIAICQMSQQRRLERFDAWERNCRAEWNCDSTPAHCLSHTANAIFSETYQSRLASDGSSASARGLAVLQSAKYRPDTAARAGFVAT